MSKAVLWESWIEETLLQDLRSDETPDPVPFFETTDDGLETSDALGRYWHIGELSMALNGDDDRKQHWVQVLFESGSRKISQQTYLWVHAWSAADDIGPYGTPATLTESSDLLSTCS